MGKLVPLSFRPGIFREGSDYTDKASWRDSNYVRFRGPLPEKIGGWDRVTSSTIQGTCRHLHQWQGLSNESLLALGTHWKFYIQDGGNINDVTPIRRSVTLGTDPFATTSGSAEITVTDTSHGALLNDFVTFGSSVAVNGIPADEINAEHQITEIVDPNSYKIVVTTTASSTGSGGGPSVTADYQINVGLDSTVVGTGWGAGGWGEGGWGEVADTTVTGTRLRLWSSDHFGEDLVFNPRDGGVYYYDRTSPTARGVDAATLSGASDVPTLARQVMISDADRHVIAFGANPRGSSTQDKVLVRWSDAEDITQWTPNTTNTAGGLRVNHGSEIIRAIQMRGEILIWTDTALNSMRFLGPPYTFGIDLLATNVSLMSPNGAIAYGDIAYWMGQDQFYVYGGRVEVLPSSLHDFVFSDINLEQRHKVYAGTNATFGEIMWFYPSASSTNVDRCVVYSTITNAWYWHPLERTAWIDRGQASYPRAVDRSGNIFYHEFGYDDGSQNPPAAIAAYAETAPIELGDGDHFSFVNRIIPDVDFRGSDAASPTVDFTLTPRDYPGDALGTVDTGTVTSTSISPVDEYTRQLHVRVRGRSVALKVANSGTGTAWRLGTPRIEVRPDGRR